MDELESDDINYNDPVLVTEIFRIVDRPHQSEKYDDDDDDYLVTTKVEEAKPVVTEYAFKTAFGWEEIRQIGEHPYPDNWKQFKGPKFTMSVSSKNNEILVLGDFQSMLNHWRKFRNRYPLFREQPEE